MTPKSPEESTENKSNKKRLVPALGLAVLLAVTLAFSSCNADTAEVATIGTPIPTQTAETASPTAEILLTVDSLEIDASLLSDPNQLASRFNNELITEWFNAGATPENAKASVAPTNSYNLSEYATKIAAEYDEIFIEALLIPDWQSNSSLVSYSLIITNISSFKI